MRIISLFFILTMISFLTTAQGLCDTLSFINCTKNEIQIPDSTRVKIKKALETGSLRIVHIGDSHLQAAFFTEKVKQQLYQHFHGDGTVASPGFIFPFSMAQTNNPFYYKVDYTGKWIRTRNVDEVMSSKIGLSGITVSTKSPFAEFKIKMQNRKYKMLSTYSFDRVVLLHNADSSVKILANNENGIISNLGSAWKFDKPVDSVQFSIANTDTTKNFELYGLILEKENSTVQYHTIGVNGSMAQSYLKCVLFDDQFKLLNPDLVILSLGTNEAFSKDFKKDEFIFNFTSLLSKIHNTNPDAVVIVTIPNDQFKDGKPNKNIEVVRESMYDLQTYFSFGIWDFYEIMGGSGSINEWYKKQLTAEDRLHFNKKGYEIQGDLFFNALITLFNKN